MKTTIFVLVTIIILLGIGYFGLKMSVEKYEQDKKREAVAANILEGVELEPMEVEIDYSRKIADGSPLVFGGSHSPPEGQESAWDEFEKAGVTSLRKDLYVEFTLPRNITVEQYKTDPNLQNPENWDQKTIPAVKKIFKEAKDHNMTTIGIMGYTPRWLSYNGTAFGVPKDWQVFKDIVKKIYTLYRDDLDYVEVWNEPDHRIFLVTDKSNLTKEEAYANIYITVTNAVREVDNEMNDGKKAKFIGGVESNARASKVMNHLVNETELNIKPEAISFHAYDTPLYESSLEIYNAYAKQLGNNPEIFITEWNNETRDQFAPLYKTGNRALTFTAERLVSYLKNGITGANYFALLPINTNNRGTDENTMGFYRWIDNKAELLPQADSWRILSKSLGLGKGTSIIHQTNENEELAILGFTNSENEKGSAVVNLTDTPHLIEFDLRNTNIPKRAQFEVYEVSSEHNGSKAVAQRLVYLEKGQLSFRYLVPEKGIIGIKFVPEREWYDVLDPIINL